MSKNFLIQITGDLPKYAIDGSKRVMLSHYTNMDSLLKIINDKTLKLNSIRNLNDKLESRYIQVDGLEDLVFVSSFCHADKESIPLWHMYTEPKYGVNIAFFFDENEKGLAGALIDYSKDVKAKLYDSKDFDTYRLLDSHDSRTTSPLQVDIKTLDVNYDANGIDHQNLKVGENGYNLSVLGSIKNTSWDYEKETRLVATLRSVKNLLYLLN